MGWRPSTPLEAGVRSTYNWLQAQLDAGAPINGWPVEERAAQAP
ncbi:MAG: hypothetical protein NXI21_06565 [Alphaproteobacteria bacterium]|nr:hypothetical protein [Alphaproteobacteria bacterium]